MSDAAPKLASTDQNPAEPVPDDIMAVRDYLAALMAQGRHDEVLQAVMNLLAQVRADNDAKAERIAQLLRALYGRRSEKLSVDQLDLFVNQAQAEEAGESTEPVPEAGNEEEEQASDSDAAPERRPQRRPGRNPLPAHLPRNRIVIPVPPEQCHCGQCGNEKTCIGHEVSEVLEFEGARFVVHEYAREKKACKQCQEGVVIAPVADKVIDGGLPGPGLLAHVAVSKYLDHQPLYRQVRIYERMGVELAESTLGSWVGAIAVLLTPLAVAIRKRALQCRVLGADDTGMRVLDSDDVRGVKKGHMWAYLGYENGKPKWPAFVYTPDWTKEGPATFLAQRRSGILQGDGYAGWISITTNELPDVQLAGCWAHARRKMVEALEAGFKAAAMGVKLVGKLYEVERQAREADLGPDARQQMRQEQAAPVLEELRKWLDERKGRATPKSAFGKALTYLDNQWDVLQVYVDDGCIPIDNNLVENQIRPIALGRRNYLFCGSDAGADRAAVIYTVLATCKVVGVEPWAYLRDVLPRLARLPKDSDVDVSELLPTAWLAARNAARDEISPV